MKLPQARISFTTLPCTSVRPKVAAGVAIGELLVIEAQQVQHRGVQVVNVDLLLDGLKAEVVGGAVDIARL